MGRRVRGPGERICIRTGTSRGSSRPCTLRPRAQRDAHRHAPCRCATKPCTKPAHAHRHARHADATAPIARRAFAQAPIALAPDRAALAPLRASRYHLLKLSSVNVGQVRFRRHLADDPPVSSVPAHPCRRPLSIPLFGLLRRPRRFRFAFPLPSLAQVLVKGIIRKRGRLRVGRALAVRRDRRQRRRRRGVRVPG